MQQLWRPLEQGSLVGLTIEQVPRKHSQGMGGMFLCDQHAGHEGIFCLELGLGALTPFVHALSTNVK